MATSELHQRRHTGGYEAVSSHYDPVQQDIVETDHEQDPSCCRTAQALARLVSFSPAVVAIADCFLFFSRSLKYSLKRGSNGFASAFIFLWRLM